MKKPASPSRMLASLTLALAATTAHAGERMNWIPTWTASPQSVWNPGNLVELAGQTVRQLARVSVGGTRVRIVLSNAYGQSPLVIGAAHVGISAEGAAIQPGSGRVLTFNGQSSLTLQPGSEVISDPVDIHVLPLSQLAVSLFLPEHTPVHTLHFDGHQTAYIAAGNHAAADRFTADSTLTQRPFLAAIQVDAPEQTRAIVALGDSITDGAGSEVDANQRWPDLLAQRLLAAGGRPVAVLNQGISGARLLTSLMGDSALARLERDVLNQPGVDTLILMIGINDIGHPGTELIPHDPVPSADSLIAGYRQLIERARARGVRVIGATLAPFEGAFGGYYSAQKEQVRQAVNQFIRHSGEFDGVIDFAQALADPQNPSRLLAAYDGGDHLHPNSAGYARMAEVIDLKLLERPATN